MARTHLEKKAAPYFVSAVILFPRNDGEREDVMIERVVVFRHRHPGTLEYLEAILGFADKDASSLGHDADVVEESEELRRRLMDRAEDGSSHAGETLKGLGVRG